MDFFEPKIYETKDGRCRLSYFDPRTGKRCRPRADNMKDARRLKQQIMGEFNKGTLPSTKKWYVGTLIEIYLSQFPSSKFTANRKRFLGFCNEFNLMDINELDHKIIRSWIDRVLKEDDLSEKMGNRIKAQLNHFFKWCVEEKIMRDTPIKNIRYNENCEQRNPHPILSPEEVEDILKKAKNFEAGKLYDYLVVLAFTGARMSEVLNLKWEDVDLGLGQITIRKTKNGSLRNLFPDPMLLKYLQQMKMIRNNDYVFVNFKGQRLLESTLRDYANRFKQEYIFSKKWTMHSFRHAFAYAFKRKGGDTLHLQALLGHKTAKMTTDVYGKITAADISRANPYDFKI